MAGILDQHLAGQSYVAGESFTMGDIAAGAAVHRWLNLPVAREPRPNLERYYERLMARPAAKQALPVPLT
jgi:glutathione S-transferase